MGISFINKGGINTSDATATVDDVINPKTFYAGNKKQTGTMKNNGTVKITPSEIQQTIPQGYHDGNGKVLPVDITQLQDYKDCLELSELILS